MHYFFSFLMLTILSYINIIAMEDANNNQLREIPSLFSICTDHIAAGFGKNSTERYQNAFCNLAALHTYYGIKEIKTVEEKMHDNHQKDFTTYAKKVYTHIATPFLVKNDNDSFYIQDDMTDLALFNIKTGEKEKLHLKNSSYIRCCAKNESTNELFIGTYNGKISKTNKERTSTTQIFSDHFNSFLAPNALATEDNILCVAASHTYLADLNRTTKWINDDYQHNLFLRNREAIIRKALQDFACCYKDYKFPIKGNEEWVCNNILIPFHLIEDDNLPDNDDLPYVELHKVANIHTLMVHNHILYTGSKNGDIYIHNLHTGTTTLIPDAHTNGVSSLIPSQHNDHIFYSGSFDSTVKQWDRRKLETCTRHYTNNSQKHGISCLYESNDGTKIYAGGADGLTTWDTNNNPQTSCHIRSAYSIVDGAIKKVSLQYIDCIAANDDESEIYVANTPTGITVLSPHYSIEQFADDIAQLPT